MEDAPLSSDALGKIMDWWHEHGGIDNPRLAEIVQQELIAAYQEYGVDNPIALDVASQRVDATVEFREVFQADMTRSVQDYVRSELPRMMIDDGMVPTRSESSPDGWVWHRPPAE